MFPKGVLHLHVYNRRAATAPRPARALPTLMLEAAPVNSGMGAPVPVGAAVPETAGGAPLMTVEASGTRGVLVG